MSAGSILELADPNNQIIQSVCTETNVDTLTYTSKSSRSKSCFSHPTMPMHTTENCEENIPAYGHQNQNVGSSVAMNGVHFDRDIYKEHGLEISAKSESLLRSIKSRHERVLKAVFAVINSYQWSQVVRWSCDSSGQSSGCLPPENLSRVLATVIHLSFLHNFNELSSSQIPDKSSSGHGLGLDGRSSSADDGRDLPHLIESILQKATVLSLWKALTSRILTLANSHFCEVVDFASAKIDISCGQAIFEKEKEQDVIVVSSYGRLVVRAVVRAILDCLPRSVPGLKTVLCYKLVILSFSDLLRSHREILYSDVILLISMEILREIAKLGELSFTHEGESSLHENILRQHQFFRGVKSPTYKHFRFLVSVRSELSARLQMLPNSFYSQNIVRPLPQLGGGFEWIDFNGGHALTDSALLMSLYTANSILAGRCDHLETDGTEPRKLKRSRCSYRDSSSFQDSCSLDLGLVLEVLSEFLQDPVKQSKQTQRKTTQNEQCFDNMRISSKQSVLQLWTKDLTVQDADIRIMRALRCIGWSVTRAAAQSKIGTKNKLEAAELVEKIDNLLMEFRNLDLIFPMKQSVSARFSRRSDVGLGLGLSLEVLIYFADIRVICCCYFLLE